MTRWLVLLLGLALAGAALFALARGSRAPDPGPPLDDIDEASRARLEKVLRDAERR